MRARKSVSPRSQATGERKQEFNGKAGAGRKEKGKGRGNLPKLKYYQKRREIKKERNKMYK